MLMYFLYLIFLFSGFIGITASIFQIINPKKYKEVLLKLFPWQANFPFNWSSRVDMPDLYTRTRGIYLFFISIAVILFAVIFFPSKGAQ